MPRPFDDKSFRRTIEAQIAKGTQLLERGTSQDDLYDAMVTANKAGP